MGFIGEIIGVPLGYIVWFIYQIIQNYALSIVIFTILLKLVLIPMAIKQQKSSARMSAFQPYIQNINKKYAKNPSKKNEEMQKLYMEHKINPAAGCLPMLVPMIVLFGMIDVVYRPLTHIVHLGNDVIDKAIEIFKQSTGTSGSMAIQLNVINDLVADPSKYSELGEDVVSSIKGFNLEFLGLNLGEVASLSSITIIVPIVALVLSFLSIFISMKTNSVSADMPGGGSMKIIMFIMPVFSCWITLTVPMGVSLYWIIGYVFQIGQVLVLNKVCNIQKLKEQAILEFEHTRKNRKKKPKNKISPDEEAVASQSDKDRIALARKKLNDMYEDEVKD